MNPVQILKELKSYKIFSIAELIQMLNAIEDFNIRNNYMEHIALKCEKLILDRLFRTPREGR